MNRPLDEVYPVIFIDAIVVKVRDGQVRNKPIYVVIGVTVNGERDILGLWAGDGGEGAKFWLAGADRVEEPRRRRRVHRGLRRPEGPPDAINTVWELAIVQACIIHLIRNTFRFASRKYWDQIATTCGRSTPPRPKPKRWPGSRSSPRSGASPIRRSPALAAMPGPSSCRSWTTEAVADCLRRGASVGSVAGRGRGLAESAGAGGALRVGQPVGADR